MITNLQPYWPVLLAIGALSALAGVLVYAALLRRVEKLSRRVPKRWPLRPRIVTNGEERKVWRWLAMAFLDYTVMVKMPVTRFTMPVSKEQGLPWYELLSSLYCTFTIVRSDGKVMGCIDLSGTSSSASRSRRMKDALLNQCAIPYLLIDPADLPSLLQIRTEFLGESAAPMPDNKYRAAEVNTASATLRDSLTRKRKTRNSEMSPLTASGDSQPSRFAEDSGSHYPTSWQENSFLVPLDSRRAELH